MCSRTFPSRRRRIAADRDAHLVLVPNPPQHPRGDFGLEHGLALPSAAVQYTFSGIAVYRRAILRRLRRRRVPAEAAAAALDGGAALLGRAVSRDVGGRGHGGAAAGLECSGRLLAGVQWRHVGIQGHPHRRAAARARAKRGKIHDAAGIYRDQGRHQAGRRGGRGAAATRAVRASPPGCGHALPTGAAFAAVKGIVRRASAEHGVRGGQVPEHRRVLERRDGDDHVDGRRLHARLPLLRGGHRQSARLAGCGGTATTSRARSS